MVHAALLLLMLEAENADLVFTISLKRSTQNSQLSTSCRPITPSLGVRRDKAAFSCGCKSHPATAPAGSNRSSYGGNEMAEAFGMRVTIW
jgi:hypothetical protein